MSRSLFLLMEKSGMDVKAGIFTVFFSLELSCVSSCSSVPLIRTHTHSQVGKGELGHFICIPSFFYVFHLFIRSVGVSVGNTIVTYVYSLGQVMWALLVPS